MKPMMRARSTLRRMRGVQRRVAERFRQAEYTRRMNALLARAQRGGLPVHQAFRGVSDQFWFWLNTEGYRRSSALRAMLPSLPDEATQRRFTGASGDQNLRQAFDFYKIVNDLISRHLRRPIVTAVNAGADPSRAEVIDFGCGWGRVARFFLKDIAPTHFRGIDCFPEAIETAKETNPLLRFELIQPAPPSSLTAASCSVIYAYSVFSHLSEGMHLSWLSEFERLLMPGGLLVVTTRRRDFIQLCAEGRANPEKHPHLSHSAFPDTAAVQRDYDNGKFCFSPTGGGGTLDPEFYGEACISKKYVLSQWPDTFELVDFLERTPPSIEQNIIVARKPTTQ